MECIVRTVLDFVGLSSSPSKPLPNPAPKRPASSVLRGQAKRPRHFEDIPASVYQNARYEGAATMTMMEMESEDEEGYSYASHVSSGPRVKLTPKGVKTKTKTPKTATPAELARQLRNLRKENAALKKRGPAIQIETIGETPTRTIPTAKKSKGVTLSRETGDLPPEYYDYTTKKKWELHPIFRARELNDPKKIRAEIQEPEYALRDAEIRDGMWQIMDQMETFTKAYFGYTEGVKVGNEDGVVSTNFYKKLSPETAKVIRCIASGGPSGIYGWHNLFIDEQKRRALVMAIIGNVLTEQVFQHILFGGTDSQIATMIKLEEKYKDSDGFQRNTHYASTALKLLGGYTLPVNFSNHVNAIIGSIWTHISPLALLSNTSTSGPILEVVFPLLHKLVTHAGCLSLHMRLDPHTVYHHEPVFKEDNFTSQRMEAFNYYQMKIRNPQAEEKDMPQIMADLKIDDKDQVERLIATENKRRAKLSAEERKRARSDQALTQICILDGVTAYRVGGWETPASTPEKPVYEKQEYRNMGVRAKMLTHGWVYCRWGRARTFPAISDKDLGRKIHGAVWRDGGFCEVTKGDSVFGWAGKEEAAREALLKERRAEAGVTEEEGGMVDVDVDVDVDVITEGETGGGDEIPGLEALEEEDLPRPMTSKTAGQKKSARAKRKEKAHGSPGVQDIIIDSGDDGLYDV